MVWFQTHHYKLWVTLGTICKLPNTMFQYTLSKQGVTLKGMGTNTEISIKTLALHYSSIQHLFVSDCKIKPERKEILCFRNILNVSTAETLPQSEASPDKTPPPCFQVRAYTTLPPCGQCTRRELLPSPRRIAHTPLLRVLSVVLTTT